MTKDELAKKAGLTTYDCALPQTWLNGVVDTLKHGCVSNLPENIYGVILSGVVWCYDGSLMGYPYALTNHVLGYLKIYEETTGVKELQQEVCMACVRIIKEGGFGPTHNGSKNCESGSIASGGDIAHCTCDVCF